MADWYVRSTTGNNGNSGASWALAKATILGATSVAANGDRIFVSQVHAESTAASVTITTGSQASPSQILCVNDGATPPTALATTATATVTGAQNWLFVGFMYVYGITFVGGNSNPAGGGVLMCANNSTHDQTFEQCNFTCPNTFAASGVFPNFGGSSTVARADLRCTWINCSVKFGSSAQAITQVEGRFFWNGGGVLAGGSSPTTLFKQALAVPIMICENLDLSNCATTLILSNNAGPNGGGFSVFRDLIVPVGWVGGVAGAGNNPLNTPGRIELYNYSPPTGRTHYTIWVEDQYGTIRDETVIVKSGGLSDGYLTMSLKMITSSTGPSSSNGTQFSLASQEWVLPNLTSGTSRTLTVDFIHDSLTKLKNNEVWVEINYPAVSANSQQTLLTSYPATILTAATDCPVSSASWTTTGMANPNKQKVSVTFTPQLVGQYSYRVKLAKPSYTIYVDPKATIV